MNIKDALAEVEGFTPSSVTAKITKVGAYKSGENDNGPWSFQIVEVDGGRLKLKGLPEFPKTRVGQTVTLRANQSDKHGLTGMKVNHEQYNNTTYHQLLVTKTCKWEWGALATNGSSPPHSTPSELSIEAYTTHLLSCAALTNQITTLLGVSDEQAIQSCFATVCIDAKNRGIVLPKTLPDLMAAKTEQGDPYEDAPKSIVDDSELPPDYDETVPF